MPSACWPQRLYNLSYPNFRLPNENAVFDHSRVLPLHTDVHRVREAVQLRGAIVSVSSAARDSAASGEVSPEDEDPGARTVVVSHSLWKTTLGDAGISADH